ncbi:M20/M25/M40 family metallo-hydrolase [Sphingomonas koreensis]|uniref:M20/M25/M40 family metallo-hydrolase n=1 Tax=Sphingomonas koreensis TaxID=93064 RepID=UPI00082D52A3|nr:M20/M25/M40 family metallo-hydrolase [Sphingomonas koreensis]PJI89626.1 di/tripeptidase [Sphingomonas koreensis]RSU61753.1 M20/M25/M40 family metallo-hydrolase [Sphingomonas koreensis]RSU70407.1 M20/M25/M40 family metallo-hydrolase [Sphingomonas koreensis]
MTSLATLALLLAAGSATASATPGDKVAKATLASASYRAAAAQLDREHDRIVEEIVKLTEIPAPPFKEAKRAAAYREMLAEAGLTDVEIDAEGNAMGLHRGTGPAGGPVIVLAAHLDTVFPEETNVKVRREGTRLHAPGIGDDTRSLAVLLAYARALKANAIKTKYDILFVGNVGEEGPGDLRGVRYLFTKGKYKDRVRAFMSMDGTNPERIVTGGVGSKRYRVTYKGPGGHSYGAFGLVNPMVAAGRTVTDFYTIPVPKTPKTTYAASVTGGGTSVNSIPNEIFVEFDMRSENPAELAKVEARFKAIVQASVDAENAARSTREGKITADLKMIGDRPAGSTPATAEIVQIATAVITAKGMKPAASFSSTDSNLPMSLGIPAITIGSGGKGDRAHSLDEWIDVEKGASVQGMSVGLGILLAAAGAK